MSLSIESVTVRYDGASGGADGDSAVVAVDTASLDMRQGEVVALVGPSGSGKSTLLRAVAGLEPLSSGRVLVEGRDLHDVPAHARGIGMMFQDNALFAHLTVGDNIGYGLDVAGWDSAAKGERVAELLELVGLNGYDNRAVDQLSGGESQRVALARSLAPRPSVLLLDEPLGSLDRLLRDQLVEELAGLLREVGQTALYVTHDQDEAFALADRIAVLSGGRFRQVGRPDQLWKNPQSGFVARFLGHPNVWSLEAMGEHRLASALRDVVGDSSLVLVPLSAVSVEVPGPHEDQSLDATVLTCRFNQGLYDIVLTPALDGIDRIAVRHGVAVEPGSLVSVLVDVSAAVALATDAA